MTSASDSGAAGPGKLAGADLRKLKGMGQLLKPVVHVGKGGLTPELVASVQVALADHELIKVKFEAHKDEKKALAPELASRTGSQVVQRVGNVLVLFRQHPLEAKRKITLPGSAAGEPPVSSPAAAEAASDTDDIE